MTEDKSKTLHHLENASVYEPFRDLLGDREPVSLPGDGVSTPKYENPPEEHKNLMNRLIYSGIVIPEKYDGTQDPQIWLDDYEDIANCNLWTENDKFARLISVLEGAPKDWFRNERKRNPAFNWTLFKIGLKDKYTNKCDNLLAYSKIMRRDQEKGEPLNSYWESKLGLIERTCPQMSTAERITHLFNGLKSGLYAKVIQKYVANPPETLEELYIMCKRAEDAYNFVQPRGEGSSRRIRFESNESREEQNQSSNRRERRDSPKPNDQMGQLVKAVQGLVRKIDDKERDDRRFNARRNAWTPRRESRETRTENERSQSSESGKRELSDQIEQTSSRSQRDLSNIQCYYCKENGHFANRCPKREQDRTKPKNELRRQN
jgi:hypothetical protein